MAEDKNIFFMKRALGLARRGRGKTFPNPMVGAVIVKNGKIAGEGFHRKAGEKHAEVIAVESAGRSARKAILYINLEPCSHSGKTPPCAEALIKAGISRVVCAMEDPDPRVSGRGFTKLQKSGIEVVKNVLRERAESLNEAYIINKTKNRPFVTIKSAMTLDGKIATRTGLSRWITSKESREFVHKLRAKNDAVLTGIGTVLRDDPRLSARTGKNPEQPYKIIVDSGCKISTGAAVFKENPGKVIIASAVSSKRLENSGASVIECPGRNGLVSLPLLLEKLLARGISTVLVEAGGEINSSFLEERIADRVYLFYAPKILGGRRAPTSFEGEGVETPGEAVGVAGIKFRRIGGDFLIEGYPKF